MAVVGTNKWQDIAYGNGKYVAVGYNGYVTTSTDGKTWTTPKQVGTGYWNTIAYGNGKFVMIGGYSVSSSADGITWSTIQYIGSDVRASLGDITYGNGKFVIAMWDGYITTSTDGETWTKPARKFGPKFV